MLSRLASPRRRLSSAALVEAREHYDLHGYAVLRQVLDPVLMKDLQLYVTFLTTKYPSVPPEHLHHTIMRNEPFWVRAATDKRLLLAAAAFADFLKPGAALFSSHILCKPPHTGAAVAWHQDGSYWPSLSPMNVLTFWLAVDASTTANGCLRVVAGSHNLDLQPVTAGGEGEGTVLASATHSDADVEALGLPVVDLELEPGDVSVHHPNIIHGSAANTSDVRRCGMTLRYMAPTTRCSDPSQPVMLMQRHLADQPEVQAVNTYHSWPAYRPGYDYPFDGCELWNASRIVHEHSEPWFQRTDYDAVDEDVVAETRAFIDSL